MFSWMSSNIYPSSKNIYRPKALSLRPVSTRETRLVTVCLELIGETDHPPPSALYDYEIGGMDA